MKKTSKKLAKNLTPRMVVAYTPNFAVAPFEVVFDSSVDKGDAQKAVDRYRAMPAEDSEVRLFRVSWKLSNKEVLEFMNGTLEVDTHAIYPKKEKK